MQLHNRVENLSDVSTRCSVLLQGKELRRIIMRVISSFPKGFGRGCDGLLPQHLKDLTSPSAGDGGAALVGLNLTALPKKSDGVHPIAVGCTL